MRASYILCLATLLAACHEQDPAAPTTGPASPGHLASLSSGSCVQVPQGVVGWWTGDGTTRDAAGGHHGSAVGNVSFGPGKVGQAYSLQRDGYVEVPDDPAWTFGTAPFTIELWAYLNSVTGGDAYLGHDEGPGDTNKWIFWDEAGAEFHVNSPTLGAGYPILGGFYPEPGKWYHLAVTRTGDLWTLYVNGIPVTSNTSPVEVPDADWPLEIGRAEAFGFDGFLDEITIYSRGLSPSDIGSVANAGSAGKCLPGRFAGFFQPVDNVPTVNTLKAGSAVPVKFSLNGNQGLDIFDLPPISTPYSCANAPTDLIEQTTSASAGGLSFDAGANQYIYVWKTEPGWKGTCRQLGFRLKNGTSHAALFQFTR